jgi:hypothetical protein
MTIRYLDDHYNQERDLVSVESYNMLSICIGETVNANGEVLLTN